MRVSFITLLAMTVLLSLTVMPNIGMAQIGDPGFPDTLFVDSAIAFSGGDGVVPLYFLNDEALAGLEITLTHNSPDIDVDSFSFLGGRLESFSATGYKTRPGGVTIYCIAYSDLIPPGNGALGNLYFGYEATIDSQVVEIDTVTVHVDQIEYALSFSDGFSTPFTPQYVKGYLDIKGGCCIGDRGNIDNDPTDAVDIADLVYLVDYMFVGGPEPVCIDEANLDADPLAVIDISDLVYLIDFMFQGGPDPPPCY